MQLSLVTDGKVDPIYSPKQVAALTSLSRVTIWRMAKAGKFPAPVRIAPGRVGFRHSDIVAWQASLSSGDHCALYIADS